MPKRVNRRNLIVGIFQVINEEDSRKSKTREKEENNQGKVQAENENEENGRQKKKIRTECWKKEMEFGKKDNVKWLNKKKEKRRKRKGSSKAKTTKRNKKQENGEEREEPKKKWRKKEKTTDFLPPKKDDPGTFSFYCCIGNILQCDALADLGSCANILPLSMYKRGRLGEQQPTNTILRLADSTAKYPEGIVKNVKVKVGNMNFLADFMVLDTTEDVTLPVIFGRPFLATINAIINVAKGEMETSNGHYKKKVIYAAKILHKAPTPPIPDFVLEYVRRKKRECEEELSKEEEEEAEKTRRKMEEDLRLPWREEDKCQEEKKEFTLPPPPPTP